MSVAKGEAVVRLDFDALHDVHAGDAQIDVAAQAIASGGQALQLVALGPGVGAAQREQEPPL